MAKIKLKGVDDVPPGFEDFEVEPTAPPKEDEAAKWKDMYIRTQADFENFKRRNQTAVQSAETEGVFEAARLMLPTYDALEKAIESTAGDIKKGLQSCLNSIIEGFNKLGIEPIEAVGKDLDPSFHNAVVALDDDKKNSGKVIAEYQKGFKMNNRVLRYSMVAVGK